MKITEILVESTDITTAYHITLEENLEDIMEYGLDPSFTNDKLIYLMGDEGDRESLLDQIRTVERWIYASTAGSDSPLVLLKINVAGLPIKQGFDANGWWYSTSTIPANRITNLGTRLVP